MYRYMSRMYHQPEPLARIPDGFAFYQIGNCPNESKHPG
jgi:hypothetical protein